MALSVARKGSSSFAESALTLAEAWDGLRKMEKYVADAQNSDKKSINCQCFQCLNYLAYRPSMIDLVNQSMSAFQGLCLSCVRGHVCKDHGADNASP